MPIKPGIKIFLLAGLLALISSLPTFAADVNYPYISSHFRYPIPDDPYAGYGSMHSCLAASISTALWNPAGITKVQTGEVTILLGQHEPSTTISYNSNVEESTFNFGEDSAGFSSTLYYTHTPSGAPTTKEVLSSLRQKAECTDISYGQIVKFNDFFTLGMMTRGNTLLDLSFSGQVPLATSINLDVSQAASSGMFGNGIIINGDGTITVSQEGFSHTSDGPLWSGFLTQSSTTPATTYTEAINNLAVSSDIIFTAATQTGPISWGINVVPINASATINNTAQAIIEEDATDVSFYTPDVNLSNEAEVVNWLSDPALYGAEDGYNKQKISIPAGEIVADAAYQGTYTGSAMRLDLGATYDIPDWLTISVVAENFNGATLQMEGSGTVAYATHRINTAEAPTMDINTGVNWSPFTDYQQTVSGSENWDPGSSKNFVLPKRLRCGIALRKPFLFFVDWDQQLTPLEFVNDQGSGYTTTKISNINILRTGFESQILILPLWIRGSTSLLLKPTVENNPSLKESVDSAFATLPVIPASLDLGGNIRIIDTDLGASCGFNALTLLSLIQIDTVNNNLSKMLYFSIYFTRDPWSITFSQALDPMSTASQYVAAHGTENLNFSDFQLSDVKWLKALVITYRF